jgi:NitT/TauT family transport system substrate-binding protein
MAILKAGNGAVAVHYASELARADPIISYVSTRAYAEKNPEAIKAFRASIEEAAPIVNGDREKASASISKFTKQPIEIVRLNRPDIAAPALKGSDFTWWLEVMKQQDMLQSPIDVEKLVAP